MSDAEMMTAACLLDAACDAEHAWGFRKGFRQAATPETPRPSWFDWDGSRRTAALGRLISDHLRPNHGSYAFRERILALVPVADAVWAQLEAEGLTDALAFDFEVCPVVVREGLRSGAGDEPDPADLTARCVAIFRKPEAASC